MHRIEADVLVVGAGPGGCSAALFLARQGVTVTVLDKALFPRDKVCGDGLAPRAVGMLRRMGLERALIDEGYRPVSVYRIVSTWGDDVEAGLPGHGYMPDYAYVVPRRHLDQLLLDAVRAEGVTVLEGVRAVGGEPGSEASPPEVRGRTLEGEDLVLRARVVVAADGAHGSFSRSLTGEPACFPSAVCIRAYAEGVDGLGERLNFFLDKNLLPGYGWAFPGGREGDPANVGCGVIATSLRRRPERLLQLFHHFLGPDSLAWPHVRNIRLVSPPLAFPLRMELSRGRRRTGATLFVGDAAQMTDPLSGEGIAYAMESGLAAAEAAHRALRSGRLACLEHYEAGVDRTFGVEFLAAHRLRLVLEQSWGNGMAVRFLRRNAELARGGMGVLANTIPADQLFRPEILRRIVAPRQLLKTFLQEEPAYGEPAYGEPSYAPGRGRPAPA